MIKKFLAFILFLAVLFQSVPTYAESVFDLGEKIEADLDEFAQRIIRYKKPAKEFSLNMRERFTIIKVPKLTLTPVMYNRVYVYGRTVLIASAGEDKKFTTDFIITGEPGFPRPAKHSGIFVGENISVIENLIGSSAEEITKDQEEKEGIIDCSHIGLLYTNIAYKNGKIIEIHSHSGYLIASRKAWNFAKQKAEELGLNLTFKWRL